MSDIEYDVVARLRYAAKAEAWTREQAERLGFSVDEILAAIRRGWLPEDIAALPVAQAECLALTPAKAIGAKLKAAPVLPVNPRVYFLNGHERYVTSRNRAA